MGMTVEITGLNLERLLTMAAQEGIVVSHVRRVDARYIRLGISAVQKGALSALCERYGWEMRVVSRGMLLCILHGARRRPMMLAGMLLYVTLMQLSSNMIWHTRIEHAGKTVGEIRSYLSGQRIGVGRLKRSVSVSALRDALMLRLPDLSHVSVRFEGSVLVIDCQPALQGEVVLDEGNALDVIAAEDGLITAIRAYSGTPVVSVGQAVRTGDVLIRGEERGEKGSTHPVAAQGMVMARVWVRADARVSRRMRRTVETGAVRRRVTLVSPWHKKVVREAKPFKAQDVSVEIQPVIGLFVPLRREIETLAEVEIMEEERSVSEASSMAQGAAWQAAKNKCPAGVHILDKSVENSMIDNEYVYAAVVLEYESNIAARAAEKP